jgi:hypothetical protein
MRLDDTPDRPADSRSKTMTRSTFARFAAALAIGATVLATGTAANARGGHGGSHGFTMMGHHHRHHHHHHHGWHGPNRPDDRVPVGPVGRPDDRVPVRPVTVRDHRGPYGVPQGGVTVMPTGGWGSVVRDHRSPFGGAIVRDHR